MKNKKIIFLFCLSLFIVFVTPLLSLSIGRDGESYVDNGVLWQPVKFKNGKIEFKAVFPGEPHAIIRASNGITWHAIHSEYGLSEYQFHTDPNIFCKIPKNKNVFLEEITTFFQGSEVITLVDVSDKNIVNAAEISTFEEGTSNLIKILRIYITKNGRTYYAFIEGKDFTLATEFFNSFQFSE